MLVSRRTVLRSIWMQALVFGVALLGYHCAIAVIHPQNGVILATTFPLYAAVSPIVSWWAILAGAIFIAWFATVRWFSRRSLGSVPIFVAIVSVVALNIAVAMMRGGPPALWQPFTRIKPEAKAEYLADIGRVGADPIAFVRDYPQISRSLSLHSTSHPPWPVLYLWAVSRLFGDGIRRAAWSAIIGTALSVYPFLLLARTLLGETQSRYAVALYAVTPSLVLFGATSMDGVFVFFPMLAAYFFHKSWGENPILYSVLTGLALVAATFFTFVSIGVALLFTMEAIFSIRMTAQSRRIWRNLVYAGVTFVLAHGLLYLVTGYNVIQTFIGARKIASVYQSRVYLDFWNYVHVSVGNLAAFVIGTGVITAVLCCREIARAWSAWLARRPTNLLPIGFAAAIIIFAFARMFCFETERVWMFLVPLAILPAARNLDRHQTENSGSKAWWFVILLLFGQTFATELLLDTAW